MQPVYHIEGTPGMEPLTPGIADYDDEDTDPNWMPGIDNLRVPVRKKVCKFRYKP